MGKLLRVLIVEDSPDDVDLLLRELRCGGYDPTFERVDTAQAMTAALEKQVWDVIICDYNLPNFSAPAALKLLQGSGRDLPFILVSGSIGEDTAVAAMKSGAHDYIMKGNLKRLIPAIERELREAEIRRERKRAEENLQKSELRYRTLAENALDDIFIIDLEFRFQYTNQVSARNMGRSPEELVGKRLDEVFPPSVYANQIRSLDQVLKTGDAVLDEEAIEFPGKTVWMSTWLVPLKGDDGQVHAIMGIARNITAQKQAEDLIQHIAFHDPLTDLPNRNLLYDRLCNAIRSDDGKGHPMALLLLDLDRFKEVNDTLGHDRGDEILKQVGRRLREAMFEQDIVARPGGDEFSVLLLKMANAKDIDVAIQKILKALDLPFLIEGLPIRIEASIGIALYPAHAQAAETLFRRADIAMHSSKRAGIPSTVYDPAQDKHSPQRLALMGELHYAIDHNELLLFYQPKISLKTRRVIGVEALVRWKHPLRGMIPPDQFILPAEQTGLIHPLTQWVLAAGMRQCKAWHEAGTALTVSVNLSARNLLDPKLPDQVAEQLRSAGVAPDWMTFEITESTIMVNPAHALDILMKLHEIGIRFSIDDFGTGYSSLAYLKKLPVEMIKIDKSFVINMVKEANDAVIVRSTIDLGHNMGLKVVAEGVENQDIWDRLSALGCDEAQGYYMARPMPADELTRWLSESPWGLKATNR